MWGMTLPGPLSGKQSFMVNFIYGSEMGDKSKCTKVLFNRSCEWLGHTTLVVFFSSFLPSLFFPIPPPISWSRWSGAIKRRMDDCRGWRWSSSARPWAAEWKGEMTVIHSGAADRAFERPNETIMGADSSWGGPVAWMRVWVCVCVLMCSARCGRSSAAACATSTKTVVRTQGVFVCLCIQYMSVGACLHFSVCVCVMHHCLCSFLCDFW